MVNVIPPKNNALNGYLNLTEDFVKNDLHKSLSAIMDYYLKLFENSNMPFYNTLIEISESNDFAGFPDIEFRPDEKFKTHNQVLPYEQLEKMHRYEDDYTDSVTDVILGEYIAIEQLNRRTKFGLYECIGSNNKIVLYYVSIAKAAQKNRMTFAEQMTTVLVHETFHFIHDLILKTERYRDGSRKNLWAARDKTTYSNLTQFGYPYSDELEENIVPMVKESLAKYVEMNWMNINSLSYAFSHEKNRLSKAPYFYPYKHYDKIKDNDHLLNILFSPADRLYWYSAMEAMK